MKAVEVRGGGRGGPEGWQLSEGVKWGGVERPDVGGCQRE